MAEAPAELLAPARWRAVDCISDLHLQRSEPATSDAWRRYLAAPGADALFILGDLFEVWPGDDVADAPGFAQACVQALREAATRRPIHLLHGNRDFLLGDAFARATGVQLLPDPVVLVFGGRRWLLSHGDALCLGDTDYLAFRAQVRQPSWRREFLAQPLEERVAIAQALRTRSEDRKRSGASHADVDPAEAAAWLRAADAPVLVHGHTHRPGEQPLPGGRRRIVLTDWDLAADPPRAEALRIGADGSVQREPVR